MAGDPILFINLFNNLRGPEGAGNVRGLKIDVPLVHLHRALAARSYGYIYSGYLAWPSWSTSRNGRRIRSY
jgi:hypothetical protein